jgi:hypothetical protein
MGSSGGTILESTHWMVLHRPVELTAVTVQVKSALISLSGKATYQELTLELHPNRKTVPWSAKES